MEPEIVPESPKKPSRTRKARSVPIRIEAPVKASRSKTKKKSSTVKKEVISAVQKPKVRKTKKVTKTTAVISELPRLESSTEPEIQTVHVRKQKRLFIVVNTIAIAIIALASWSVYAKPNELPPSFTIPVVDQGVHFGEVASSTPETLSIPSINLTAHVVPVGLTKNGDMNVPADFENVGWFKYGPLPGAKGNAVIDGHFDNGKGEGAVFYELSRVRVGDSVFVINKVGEKMQFKVKEVRLVNIEDLPSDLIFGETDSMNLNLITCDGVWLPDRRTYTERLVVFTERVVQ